MANYLLYILGAFIGLVSRQYGLVDACLGNVKIPTDPKEQIPTLVRALKVDNGNSRYEGPFPERTRLDMVYKASDLNCKTFEDCAWRNEFGAEGAPNVDEFDFGLASGRPDPTKAFQVFGAANTGFPADNNDKWALTGTMQGKNKANEHGALLVSDPVSCQKGPGKFRFKYWASPLTEVRVCTRRPNDAKNYIQCQPSPSSPPWYRQFFTHGWPSPGPVEVQIPANPGPFEIVIVANKFNYFVSAAGRSGYGGVVALDDISYQATLCNRPISTARPRPATTQRPATTRRTRPTDPDEADRIACEMIFCSVDQGECTAQLNAAGAPWEIHDTTFGNTHTGVKRVHDGDYALAKGPRTLPAKLTMGPFDLAKGRSLRFCFYRAFHSVYMTVNRVSNGRSTEFYKSPSLRSNPYQVHNWFCEELELPAGHYDELNLQVHNLKSRYSYFGLDDVQLMDAPNGLPLC